jgi:ectoine hydroxylase-related dioxygenase (phytanoyl-CoA dioxygenase family)
MVTDRVLGKPLVSNGFTLAMTPERFGWLVPSDTGRPVSALWEQFGSQGYLWLRGILDRAAVLEFRRRFFAAFADAGLLAPGSDPTAGVYSGSRDGKAAVNRRLAEIVRWARYEAFCLMAPIQDFYETALGGPVYLHKRKLLRMTVPADPSCTGAHYDLTYLRGGTDRVYTSWIPIGDAPAEMGGLVYLEGSDAWGRATEAEYAARSAELPPDERIRAYNKYTASGGWLTKDLPGLADRLAASGQPARWLAADYEAGDMMIHSAYMIHAATVNEDPAHRMRLSTDIRYQRVTDPIDGRWGRDWSPDDGL